MTRVKAAEVFGVTRHSVDRWVKAYRASGPDALKVRKRGPSGNTVINNICNSSI